MGESYLVTSAQAEARPNEKLLRSMEAYIAEHAGSLIVLPRRLYDRLGLGRRLPVQMCE